MQLTVQTTLPAQRAVVVGGNSRQPQFQSGPLLPAYPGKTVGLNEEPPSTCPNSSHWQAFQAIRNAHVACQRARRPSGSSQRRYR
jgi:hypothetical protein